MEYLVFIIAVIFFLLFIFIQGYISQKKQEKWLSKQLKDRFGKGPDKEYKVERFQNIPAYYKAHYEENSIDDITWNDLSMDQIYKRMDYTVSSAGEEYLYYMLRNSATQEELIHFDEIVQYFSQNEEDRVNFLMDMCALGNTGKYSLYNYLQYLDNLENRNNKKEIIPLIAILLSIGIMLVRFPIGLLLFLVLVVFNIVTYFREKAIIEPYLTSLAYIMRLITVSEKLSNKKMEACEDELGCIRKYLKELGNVKRSAFLTLGNGNGNVGGSPMDILADYFRMIFHTDIIGFNYMYKQVQNHIDAIDGLFTKIGYMESAISVAMFRASYDQWATPCFTDHAIQAEEIYHPLLSAPVKNSIQTERSVLLTGSNASGKSTFLKTVAINAILAQSVYTVLAKSYEAPMFSIYSSMSLKDDLESGDSYYIVEIKAIKRIMNQCKEHNKKVLCFVDEVLRGTNTIERIAASSQILKQLSNENAICFAATHDIELTYLLEGIYENYHFDEEMKNNDISFSYQLKEGRATTKNAIDLLRIMGYDKLLTDNAANQAERFQKDGVWKLY